MFCGKRLEAVLRNPNYQLPKQTTGLVSKVTEIIITELLEIRKYHDRNHKLYFKNQILYQYTFNAECLQFQKFLLFLGIEKFVP